MNPEFAHLNVHSEYSLIDSTIRVKALIDCCKKFSMPAVAITDHMNMFALIKFYQAAVRAGIKPIIGAELLLSVPELPEPVIVQALCKDKAGYINLTEVLSQAYCEGQADFGKPVIKWEWLKQRSNGLIILSGGINGDVGRAINADKAPLALDIIERWQSVFGDRFYLEIQRVGHKEEALYTSTLLSLIKGMQVPVVATNAVRFIEKSEFTAHTARVCINSGYVLDDHRRPENYTQQQYFLTSTQMHELFADVLGALENAAQIVKRCNVVLELDKNYLPNFAVENGIDVSDLLISNAQQGLNARIEKLKLTKSIDHDVYSQRLQVELEVIIKMGFASYFLIVADFIAWSKANGVPVGPGRGSGAGSLVAYSLGITELDPLEYDLLFERFLNPDRVSLPDFDIDFCMEGRDRVIEYVAEKYGRDCVAQIITYGRMSARAVVRDVGRILSYPYGFVDKIAKLVPFELGITLAKALQDSEELLDRYKQEEEVKTLMDLAQQLEGLVRNAGKHAGGVVIAPTKLTDFAPLYCESDNDHTVTQFDKDDIETVGLVKFDFLGLRTLTIIDWTVRQINALRLKKGEAELVIDDLATDDPKVYELLKRCEALAVFQLESRGMRDLIRRLQPDCFEEIVALVALFRPGPLQSGMVDDFIDRKHGRQKVTYLHPDMAPILEPTYGVILYQEQVMQIAQVLAGYSLGGADLLRRAMGKKKPEEMAKQRVVFESGASANNIDKDLAVRIFDLIDKFSGYGFNKSHSAAYALLSYQTAWLKTHYPAQFMASVLSSDMDNTDKVVQMVDETRRMQIEVIPPDVNSSEYMFSVTDDGNILFGLGAIKGVGQGTIESIVDARHQAGPFKDMLEMCKRVSARGLNKRAMESLVRSGACDVFSKNRAALFHSIERVMKLAGQHERDEQQGQSSLFGCVFSDADEDTQENIIVENVPAWSNSERLQGERDTIGFYVSGHPLQSLMLELSQWSPLPIVSLADSIGEKVLVAGIIQSVRQLVTKRGHKMAVMTVEDRTGKLDVTIFSKLYATVQDILLPDKVVLLKGEASNDDFSGGVRLVADKLTDIEALRGKYAKRVCLTVDSKPAVDKLLSDLPQLTAAYRPGSCELVVRYKNDTTSAEFKLGKDWRVDPTNTLLESLSGLCGADSVSVDYKD